MFWTRFNNEHYKKVLAERDGISFWYEAKYHQIIMTSDGHESIIEWEEENKPHYDYDNGKPVAWSKDAINVLIDGKQIDKVPAISRELKWLIYEEIVHTINFC